MKLINLLTILTFIFLSFSLYAQNRKDFIYKFEGGIGYSLNQNTFKWYRSTINPLFLQQYDTKRYRLPSLRLRASAMKRITSNLNAGIVSGLNVHYLERSPTKGYYTALSIPVQAGLEYMIFKLGRDNRMDIEAQAGYHFMKYDFPPFMEKGGFIASTALTFNNKNFFYKAGVEIQKDRFYFTYEPDINSPRNEQKEVIMNIVTRHSAFVSLGFSF
jgi:hypothetical protein